MIRIKKYIFSYNDFLLNENAASLGEASESITGQIILYYNNKNIPDVLPDEKELDEILDQLKKNKNLFGAGDEKFWTNKNEIFIACFSAAKGFSDFSKHIKIDEIWRTGTVWPKELVDLGLDMIGGKKGINSSDLVVKSGNRYIGVSLKLKPRENAIDPTMINNSLSALITNEVNGKKLANSLYDHCQKECEYIIDLLKDIAPVGNRQYSYKNFFIDGKNGHKNKMVPEELIKEYRKNSGFTDKIVKGVEDNNIRVVDLARFVISKSIKKKNNYFYNQLQEILIDSTIPTLAQDVFNAIFKTEISETKLEKIEFDLILLTGIQKAQAKTNKIIAADVKEYRNIYNVLQKLAVNKDELVFEIQKNESDEEYATAAGIKIKLKFKNLVLADLELRFKGKYSVISDLQFQAALSKEFIEKLKTKEI